MFTDEENRVVNLFAFVEQAGIIVCKECNHGIDNLSSLRSHLKISKHANIRNYKISAKSIRVALLKGTRWENSTEFITNLPVCFGGTVTTQDQRRYQSAPENTNEVLVRIKELPVKMGFVCTECKSFCEKSEDIFKDHLIREHSIEATHALSKVRNTGKRPIQSLGQGSKERYFPVFVPTIEELMETVEQRQPSTDVYMFGKEDNNQRIDEVNFISELLPNSLDPIKFDDAAFNKNADITDIEADVLELMGQTAKEPIFDQKALVQVPKDALVADRSNATVIARDSQFRRKQSKRELESVYATVRHSVNPTENVLEKEEISVEQEYFDNPLHDLASDMLVNVSKMVRESDFPRTLKFMGFKYLGSIATALCFSLSRMNSAIRKISRDKAHSVNCKS